MTARTSRPGNGLRAADFTSPLTVPGPEVAGAEVVRELPQETALPVWQTLRSLLMWAAEVPAHRGELFERRAMEQWERELLQGTFDADLRCPLAVIVGELAAGESAAPDVLARSSLCVTEWGLANGAVRTALAFAEAAALCWPEHPRYAWMAGRLLRTHGRLREAEQWIKRSVRVAGNIGDSEAQTLGLNSLGNVFAQSGNYPKAVQTHLQALRLARKHRLRDREGELLHDLFVASAEMGHLDVAEGYARGALERYAPAHARLLPLAHDVVVLWIKRGLFDRALPVLLAMLDHFQAPRDRLLILASAGRAAGACGEEGQFQRLLNEALDLTDRVAGGEGVPRVLYELALGAWSLGRWDAAEQLLERAETFARQRGEADIILEAEASLSSVRQRRAALSFPAPVKRHDSGGETLTRRFVATLRGTPVPAETR